MNRLFVLVNIVSINKQKRNSMATLLHWMTVNDSNFFNLLASGIPLISRK